MIFADGLSADLCCQPLVLCVAFSDACDSGLFSNIVHLLISSDEKSELIYFPYSVPSPYEQPNQSA
ncbi:hypothetical protein [Anoxybacillus flavithermus]|uniref:hypothetical protein n=1 Tax=Anoxybacillus flavithermus TaxID=33934 RepID=UPI0018676B5D|nr:hypothetical protein [Anoxybacillus flavithermus]MBE2923945.1 hypothetical protein [Anoxybacillus flavithermus]MBE2926671.1 hypothetical protein [Anoxybacillus flavithermus]MBE2934994.1 hypothetical protein [Anoxybacillus flavithermus]MBE2937533.1 hypothetical protein [Anoxybacillus flavithermus]MBE2947000.1 hypothetical protein [Anoxybacillus flavithermus]